MSKKNKALKQLIRAQMQANAMASAQGEALLSAQPQPFTRLIADQVVADQVSFSPTAATIPNKQTSEFVLIKKDIRLSLLLISLVIICLFVIYFVDRSNPFLLPLANKIFKLI